jgi:serine/threonine-protein kinase HipA
MNRCPITYESCQDNYSRPGLAKLSPRLSHLDPLPFTAQEQRREAAARSGKMSIQGVQPKLSARLSIKNNGFQIVDSHGTFIIKPQSEQFQDLPENEDLTMKMARVFGIDVPLTGLVYSKDGSLSYFIKRFDRYGRNKKVHVEDFAQLTGNTRNTKYSWTMERLIPVIENYCTFPLLEKRKLFRRTLFCFLTGNEDMHLKNFSLITRNNNIELSPAYDLLNSTISMDGAVEEMALPLAGKKRKINRADLFDYYGKDRLKLSARTILAETHNLVKTRDGLEKMINISFLSEAMKAKYTEMLFERYQRLVETI